MMTLRERYNNDVQFHQLVDTMTAYIQEAHFTPSEMREAAILASIKYEEMNLRHYAIVEEEMEGALRTIRRRLDDTHRPYGCNHEWWDSDGYKICKECGAKLLRMDIL
jgi:hypothetical protein